MAPDPIPASMALSGKVMFLSTLPSVEEVIETHMAFVFLTRNSALKLKKPVKIGFSDCRTLESRERAVAKELWLNRTLAPGVYLGRLPLFHTAHGFSLHGDGPVVDWLVQMKRLPRHLMLDEMIRQGQTPKPEQLDALIARLIAFYSQQTARRPPRHLYVRHLEQEAAVNAEHLRDMSAHLPRPEALGVLKDLARGLRRLRPEILARGRKGFVFEGHGDLRPEHVCLTDPPVIFDRAEAALELRTIDVWDECMFLATECAMMGYSTLGGQLAAALIAASMDPPSRELLVVYMQFRLITRARLALDHLLDTPVSTRAKWARKAQSYLDAAAALSQSDDEPVIGLPADDRHVDAWR